ncbi:protocatechuate 3,4-dioxygenase subunit alpha [Arenibacter echinorum]|uniref:Protocatechuate 3,4-dioxygenase alpha subunit n=1 Tax=Arenibacter echinorum TaxID=440515 RepID=A0A327RG76_9FLAO|nr:protocatechuate 3,4-dioxygenase subunit alpha [Arenibacter echinorum]RAJ15899.1 protocatechuate 3,4-dioxygenase alpha subunit [Arenibacter echinorum]
MDNRNLQTPSQTIGPFFAYGLTPTQYDYEFESWVDNNMVADLDAPETIEISGSVFDGEGKTINDALVELWQDDGEHKLYGRFGTGTDEKNRFIFKTIKPKSVDGQAPFINVILFMRGQLLHTYTRIYFDDEANLNQSDKILNLVESERRNTLIAKKTEVGYTINIHMQGQKETVFFDL